MTTLKWRDDQTEAFIEYYRREECLWDISNEAYRNNVVRQEAYQRICDAMNMEDLTVPDVVKKIKSLRTTYKGELNKVLAREKCSYRPQLFWFNKADAFLRSTYAIKESSSSSPGDSPQDNAIEMPSIKEEEVEDIEIVEHEIPVNNNSKGIGSLPGSESLPAHAIQMIEQNNIFTKILQQARNASNQNLSSNKRPASTKEDTKIDESRKPQKIAKVCTCNGEDEFDLFGKTIAIQLKRMPLDRALMCQQSLMEIIGKERLLQMGLNRK